jgi:hypothetical protein
MPRRVTIGRMPDPARAHGAWVYLIVSVLAGSLTAVRDGFLPALLAGVGFAGVFLVASSAALGWARGRQRLLLGLAVAILAPTLALLTGADPSFLVYGLVALAPAALAAWFAERDGFQSPAALAFGVAALVLAAPSSACAGGAHTGMSLLLLVLLTPFFVWRAIVVRRRLTSGEEWSRSRIRTTGLREAVLAVAWTAVVVLLAHVAV